MAFEDCRLPIADCRLNYCARAARFGVRRLDAAFAVPSNAAFAFLFAGSRLQF
jgi:hypothetical protein